MNNTRWILLFAAAAVATFVLGFLIASISERRAENLRPTQVMVTPIGEWETDPKVWGANFPREYETWLKTRTSREETWYPGTPSDKPGEPATWAYGQGRTKWGGSDGHDKLARFPNLKVLYAGFAFAKEYNRKRGHAFAVEDVTHTKRIKDDQGAIKPTVPGTCFACKSPDVPRLMHEMGVQEFYKTAFKDLVGKVQHPISCLDCHDSKTMDLRISRPAFVEAMGRRGIDVAKATHQEMRSYVCAQCHVTYYFQNDKKSGKSQYLTFPWDNAEKGKPITGDAIVAYFDEKTFTDPKTDQVKPFSDWTHGISKTPTVKIRHPEFELWSNGIHAYRGVSCADCHMPYKSEGGVKVTDHQVKSPLMGNIAQSCQVCHRWSESEIRARVEGIQDKTFELQNRAEIALIAAHKAVGEALTYAASDEELKDIRQQIRNGQLYWDFIAAENSMGFHAPQEAASCLAKAIDLGRQAESAARLLIAKKQAAGIQPTAPAAAAPATAPAAVPAK